MTQTTNHGETELTARMAKLSGTLREAYYLDHKKELCKEIRAFGGTPKETIGPWPEYNLRGNYCKRSLQGLCSPCFYAKFPEIVGLALSDALKQQINKILEEFEYIENNQYGKLPDGIVRANQAKLHFRNTTPLGLCVTPCGSFFDNNELPPEVRLHLLQGLINKRDTIKRDIVLYVESHAKDLISHQFTLEEINIIQEVQLRVVLGFESRNDFVRNVLYNKNLELNTFEQAVTVAKKNKVIPYAFVIAGLSPMNNSETIQDVSESIDYLIEKEVTPVLMFTNIQRFTIADVLTKQNQDIILKPRTVLEILKSVIDKIPENPLSFHDSFLVADPVGGPPEPDTHIFSSREKVTCDKCSTEIYDMLLELRNSHDTTAFRKKYNELAGCECADRYKQLLEEEKNDAPLLERTISMIGLCESSLSDYIHKSKMEEIIPIKAGLLCRGVKVDPDCYQQLSKAPYLLEKGFVHSPNILLGGIPVNACINEGFCESSPYSIVCDGEVFNLLENDQYIINIEFMKLEPWCYDQIEGITIGEFIRPHASDCIGFWPNQLCALTEKCEFCNLKNGKPILKPALAAKMVCHALSNNPNYQLALGGGIYHSFEENIAYFSEIARIVKTQYQNTQISLETVPPLNLDDLSKYKSCGIDSLIMNLEIFDEAIRHRICPQKSTISVEHYFKAFKQGLEIFGEGKISSVIIVGLQPDEDVRKAAKAMIDLGVIPTLMPFQPLNGTPLENHPVTNIASYLRLSEYVSESLSKQSIKLDRLVGCTKCGACSLETSFLQKLIKETK